MARFGKMSMSKVGLNLYEARLTKLDGSVTVLRSNSVSNLEYACERELKRNSSLYVNPRGGSRANAGRRKGTTKSVVESRYQSQRVWQKVFGEKLGRVVMAANAAAAVGSVKITESLATDMLDRLYRARGKYNVYSANLSNSYVATIVQGRRIVQMLKREPIQGNKFVPRNGKRVVRIKQRRHATRNKWKYRYVKYYERQDGYDGTGITAGRDKINPGMLIGGNNNNEVRRGRIQSAVIVENTAPYAGAVHARGYNVLPNAILRGYNGRSTNHKQVVTVLTKNMLHAAKLI